MFKRNRLFKCVLLMLLITVLIGNTGCARFLKPTKKLDYSVYNPKTSISARGEYVIGVRDILDVAVWRCPELETTVMVRPEDGKISLPLIGEVEAAGMTPRELALSISRKMAYYVKDPRVAVAVKQIGNKKVFIMGQVLRNGTVQLERGDRIIDLITRAGGFTDNAVPSCTHIVRGGYQDPEIVRVNLARLIFKGDTSQNVYLKEGDIVYVPENEIEQLNYVLRKIFPSMFFAEKLANLKRDIMIGRFDWHTLWLKAVGKLAPGYRENQMQ